MPPLTPLHSPPPLHLQHHHGHHHHGQHGQHVQHQQQQHYQLRQQQGASAIPPPLPGAAAGTALDAMRARGGSFAGAGGSRPSSSGAPPPSAPSVPSAPLFSDDEYDTLDEFLLVPDTIFDRAPAEGGLWGVSIPPAAALAGLGPGTPLAAAPKRLWEALRAVAAGGGGSSSGGGGSSSSGGTPPRSPALGPAAPGRTHTPSPLSSRRSSGGASGEAGLEGVGGAGSSEGSEGGIGSARGGSSGDVVGRLKTAATKWWTGMGW